MSKPSGELNLLESQRRDALGSTSSCCADLGSASTSEKFLVYGMPPGISRPLAHSGPLQQYQRLRQVQGRLLWALYSDPSTSVLCQDDMLWLLLLILPCLGDSLPLTPAPRSDAELMGIMGNHKAPSGRWPWQVSLWFYYPENKEWNTQCGGSLIHKEWVLTAAHCVKGVKPENVRVQVGQAQHSWSGDHLNVTEVIPHKDYNDEQGPEERLSPVKDLQEVEVPIVDTGDCSQTFQEIDKVIKEDMLCAGSVDKDSCQGDSGGPLVCKIGHSWVQEGVVSWGSWWQLDRGAQARNRADKQAALRLELETLQQVATMSKGSPSEVTQCSEGLLAHTDPCSVAPELQLHPSRRSACIHGGSSAPARFSSLRAAEDEDPVVSPDLTTQGSHF
ncbi:PREDICTED: mastin-like [Chrysochloris asiatica]|uniref:Mastin-like n=1 Tax=Chrysochloris asiatica TaxID=185453 RepID=A0A9B0TZ19_CHRAS|nr:PREDICTED: mastin-like [Chrysochloris asiatica]